MRKTLLSKMMLLLMLLIVGVGSVWGTTYTELFTITSGNVVSNSSYAAYTATVSERGYVITFGGNNKSVGTNSNNRSKCNLGNYSKYTIQNTVSTSDVASAFACTTSLSNVAKISYTFSGGSNQTNTNVYLLYSENNSTFSPLSLISGTQGASISSGTAYTFTPKNGYFALLFVATNSTGNWRIDDVSISFYEEAATDLSTFAFATSNPSVTLSKNGLTFDASYTQAVSVEPAAYDGTITYSFVEASSTFDLTKADIDETTGDIEISATSNLDEAKTIVVKASATATTKYNKPSDATYTLTVNPAPDGVGTPEFLLTTGSYYYGTTFTINSANSNQIFYTTDGSNPSKTNGTLYSGAIAITASMTVKAIGYDDNDEASEIGSVTYTLKAPEDPSFSISGGGVTEGTILTLTMGDGGTKVVYTTDGTDPIASSETYSSAITINYPTTIKAATVDAGDNLSSIVTNAYTIVVTKTVTLWSEDFSGYNGSTNRVPKDGTYSYTCTDGGSTTQVYEEDYAEGSSPELLVSKSNGAFKATIPLDNIVSPLTLTYKSNNSNLSVSASSTTSGASAGAVSYDSEKKTASVTISGVTKSMTSLDITFTNSKSGNCRLDNIELKYNKQFTTETVKVTAAEYATYVSTNALDFTGKGIKAYIAKTKGDGSGVTFEQVNKIPASTGVLLYIENGATENIPIFDGTGADNVSNNKFVKGSGTAVVTDDGTNYNYILNNVGGNIGFYKAAGNTVANNRAYISILKSEGTPIGVKEFFSIDLGEEGTDGIGTIDNGQLTMGNEDAIYNLAGQRVQKPVRGLYIKNGKKILVK